MPSLIPVLPPVPIPPLLSTQPTDISQPPGSSSEAPHIADYSNSQANFGVGIGPFSAHEAVLMDCASAIIQALSKGGCCACPARSPSRSPLVDPVHMKLVQQALTDITDAQQFFNSALMRQYEAVSRSVWRVHGLNDFFEMSRLTNSVPFQKQQVSLPKHHANPTRLMSAPSQSTKHIPDQELDNSSDVEIVGSTRPSNKATQKKRRLSASSEGSVELVENQTTTSFSASSEVSLFSDSDDLPSVIMSHQPQRLVAAGRESQGSGQTQERKFVLHVRLVHLKFILNFHSLKFCSNNMGV